MIRKILPFLFLLTVGPSQVFALRLFQGISAEGEQIQVATVKIIKLKALQNDVVFHFAPITNPSLHYEFRLFDYDKRWKRAEYPVTNYTNLKGDEYRFEIRLMEGKSILVTESIPISVEKELQEEWWFIPIVIVYIVLLISAAIYFFLLYSFRQKLKLQAMRYKIASDLHDEVGATLSSIAISARLVQNKVGHSNPDVQPILDRIKFDSEETIHTIRDTVWAINPDNDSSEKLFEKMRSFAFQILSALDITVDFENSILPGTKLKMSMEQRRNVYLLFKEAINNIAKHSGASKVSITIIPENDSIKLTIEDNGIGFEADGEFEGNGLKNYKNRAQEGFMDFNLTTGLGKGTRIEVGIPEI